MERYTVHHEYLMPYEHGNVVLYADAQATVEALQAQVGSYKLVNGMHLKTVDKLSRQVEALQAKLEAAERHNTILQDANKVALGKVEALQRERDSLREALDGQPCNEDFRREAFGMSKFADECMAKRDELQAKVNGLEHSRNSFEQRCEELSEIDCGLREQLTQLQALVRALPVQEVDPELAKVVGLTFAGQAAEAMAQLMNYRATLDATTPATKGGDGE